MPNYTLSPNMSLIVPTVSVAPGPDWAQYLNSSLSILDQHTHTSGSGVAITQDAISLSPAGTALDSLSFNNSNAISLRSGRFYAQSAALALATDIGCVYVAGVDLYYNDVNGNQIRITQSGSVAGSSGTITGLPSGTASASYSAGTFVFQAATSTAANIDGASYIFRNNTASSFGLTLSPPAAMAANYSLTLPALPVATSIMRLDTSGNMSANLVVDNSSIEISSNTLRVKASGITQTMLNISTFTPPTIQKFTSGSGTYTTPAGVFYIKVKLVGGGGGGAGGGTGSTSGGTGGNTTFGTSLLVGNGGVGGDQQDGPGGTGGTASLGTAIGVAVSGGFGGKAVSSPNQSGFGGNAPYFGGGAMSPQAGNAGSSAVTNTGGGGSGGSASGGNQTGGGGGSGGFVDAIITSPSASYSYAVGSAGTAGPAGSGAGAQAGGAGAAGIIIVEEYYQ